MGTEWERIDVYALFAMRAAWGWLGMNTVSPLEMGITGGERYSSDDLVIGSPDDREIGFLATGICDWKKI